MNLRSCMLAGLAALILLPTSSQAVGAEFTAKDCQVLGRTLSFVGDGVSGPTAVGVVFDPDNPLSSRDAERVRSVIGDRLQAGRVVLSARLIPVDQLDQAGGSNALYVTEGLADHATVIAAAARRLHIPTISADLSCVEAGPCVVGFASDPTVQIVIDRAAAERSGVRFVQAFRLLVREK